MTVCRSCCNIDDLVEQERIASPERKKPKTDPNER